MNKIKRIFILIIFGFSLINCKSSSNHKISLYTSIISIIANPKDFHKKTIIVQGYFTMETEGQAIYLSKNDFEKNIFKNALYLYIPYGKIKEMGIELPYKGYVEIQGTFNKNSLGSYGFFSGGIEDISKINRLYKKGSKTEEFDME